MDGDWHDLGGVLSGESTEFVELQPLAGIDDPSERGWAAEWIGAILGRERIEVTPEAKEHLWSALTSLASAPMQERTLTGLCPLLQSNFLKRALQPYCLGGPYGRLLDAEFERLGEGSVQVFETDGLIGTAVRRPSFLICSIALRDGSMAGQHCSLSMRGGLRLMTRNLLVNSVSG